LFKFANPAHRFIFWIKVPLLFSGIFALAQTAWFFGVGQIKEGVGQPVSEN
jgi:hypothetical protein